MKVIITESRLIDLGSYFLNDTYNNLDSFSGGKLYKEWDFALKDGEIVFMWSKPEDKIIFDRAKISDPLVNMFSLDYEQKKESIRKWFSDYLGIEPPTKIYFGSFNHIDLDEISN
jgi:hypothetical protein